MVIYAIDNSKTILDQLDRTLAALSPQSEIHCFDNSPEALAAARKQTVHAAFLGMNLTEIDGLVLGQYLKDLNPYINLIYLTESRADAFDAMALRASGCVLKPVTDASVGTELEELRYKTEASRNKRVFIQTFGDFEIFADGKPIAFKYSRTKEMMAILVSKRGAQTTNGEIIATLWEDDGDPKVKGSYLSNLRQDLQNTLSKLRLTDIIYKQRGSMAIAKDRVECDLYEWLDKKKESRYQYVGDFMDQYSWSEYLHAELDDISYAMDEMTGVL